MPNYICGMCSKFELSKDYPPYGVCMEALDDPEYAVMVEGSCEANTCELFDYACDSKYLDKLQERYGALGADDE